MKKINFNVIYQKIYTEHGNTLNALRSGMIIKDVISIIVLILLEYLLIRFSIVNELYNLMGIGSIVIILLYSLLMRKSRKNYVMQYKIEAIKTLVNFTNETYKYSPDDGVTSSEYNRSGFDCFYDRFYSEDKIEGFVDENIPIKMSQVKTQRREESTDSDGHTTTTYVTTFLGIYGIITLPFAVSELRISPNSNFLKFNKDRVEMESAEFEKYFDVFAQDRQNAMEVLTPDTIEEMVRLKNRYKKAKKFNITLKNRYLYFRVGVGDIFEPPTFKSAVDYSLLLKYFEIIDLPREIYESLESNIKLVAGYKDKSKEASEDRLPPEKYFQKNI